jgi:hypothetical protein
LIGTLLTDTAEFNPLLAAGGLVTRQHEGWGWLDCYHPC